LKKRTVDILVASDIHLGTLDVVRRIAQSLLKSIHRKHVILNGDIIDYLWHLVSLLAKRLT